MSAALNYNTIQFLAFCAVLYAIYVKLKHHRPQNLLLLAGSYVFYASFSIISVVVIFLSSLADFAISRHMASSGGERKRTRFLIAGVSLNMATLGCFKYYSFFIPHIMDLLTALGFNPHYHTMQILLPLGISFYTVQKISYLVDVYKRRVDAIDDLPDYLLFVSFFPKLLSGPIETAKRFIPQIMSDRSISREDVRVGFLWVVTGYFVKMVIADSLAPMVDRAFDYPDDVSGITALLAAIAYSFQLYADFAGYTLIVRGISRLMGFHLMENFRMPYHSRNPRAFWSRWHLSLSTWIRDYIYIPLGGNQKGRSRTVINLMVTMFLAGLWHGTGWNYALWGIYHGLLLSLSHLLGFGRSPEHAGRARAVFETAVTFVLVSFGWLFFRTENVTELGYYLRRMVTDFRWDSETLLYCRTMLPICLTLYIYDSAKHVTRDELILLKMSPAARTGVYVFLGLCIVSVGFKQLPFIYFQY